MTWAAIDWSPVALGVVAAFLFSAVWYGVLFQHAWLRALGIRLEDIDDLQLPMAPAFLMAAVSYVVLGVVLALLVSWLDLTTVSEGLLLGGLTWLGFNATAFARLVFFEDRPVRLCLIDGGADLATHLIMGALLAAWR